MNTDLRKKAKKNDFEKDVFKLMKLMQFLEKLWKM